MQNIQLLKNYSLVTWKTPEFQNWIIKGFYGSKVVEIGRVVCIPLARFVPHQILYALATSH
jgi:hypothetical protein